MLVPITAGDTKVKSTAYHYVSMPRQVYVDLCAYVDHFDTEVSGCGMVERIEHRFKSDEEGEPDTVEIEFAIREVYLPNKQKNTRASTDIDDEVIAELMSTLLGKGKNTEHMRLHWHSHADMDTFHSGTDEENYATLSNGDFLVSLVINKAHSFLGRVDYFKPVRVSMSGLGVHMQVEVEEKMSDEAQGAIQELEKNTPKYEPLTSYNPAKYGYVDDYNDHAYYGSTIGSTVTPALTTQEVKDIQEVENITLKDNLEVARLMGITPKEAMKFMTCKSTHCHCCKKADLCQDFLYNIDNIPLS